MPADIYVRYLRLKKQDVVFIGGSDEHGVPVTIRAKKEGITVQEVVDRYHNLIKKSFEDFGISFDIYSRTTSPTHNKFASDFFRTLYDKGVLEEKVEEQFCDEVTGEFLTDRNIVGTCPRCGAEGAYGDQCEKCGATLSPEELINPTNKNNPGHGLVKKPTKNWYLPLNKYQDWLKKWILEGHKEWRTNVYGQCKSWLDMDLQPRAMTRDLDWGIPVPVEGADGKVLYVWFDAPIGYISNTKELCDAHPEKWGTWQKWWQDPETRLVHFIGKDNIVFHCIIFPTMLKAHGDYILPDNVPANEFLNLEDDKISTSRNWAVWLHEYLVDLPGKQDVLRYVLTANAPETKDNNFTWKDFQERNNSELVAVYGNFVNRALQLTKKYWGGVVPACGELQEVDEKAIAEFKDVKESGVILLNLPLALIGGVIILWLTSGEISIPAIIGFISLFGIATRNGMLLISHYTHLRGEGMGLRESVIQGSLDRLNPILMTALSSALALIPLALNGDLPGNEIQSPMATVILGGLLTSTFLNGFIIPIVYLIMNKNKE